MEFKSVKFPSQITVCYCILVFSAYIFRFEGMRENQEKLAKERIAARQASRKQGKEGKSEDITVTDPDDVNDAIGWQDAIIKEVETKHEQERELLLEVPFL